MVDKITTPPTNNEVIDKVNEIIDNLGGFPYGESDSAADAVQKEVTISEITTLRAGQIIIVKPTITSTVADATLKLNSFTAYPILYGAAAITTSTDSITWAANYPSWFRFDGSNWVFLGHGLDNNTTYSTMSVSEGTTGTKTTARSVRADYLKQIIQGTTLTGLSTSTNSAVTASDTVTTGIGKLQAQVNSKQAEITSSNKLSASLVSDLATVATSGSYNDLSDKPTIPTATSDLTNDSGFITLSALTGYATESWVTQQGYITSSALSPYVLSADLATVATSGSYNDLSNKPTIPAAQVNSDWNASSGVAQILNKPTIPTVPTNVSAFTNDSGYITSSALTGYEQTSNKVTSISSSSTNNQYPSAKCVYDIVGDIETLINAL